MISVSTLALGLTLLASPYATRAEAADIVAAGGPNAADARAWLVDAGRPGLWALNALAKSGSSAKKANVLEAIGWWRTEEAEYVLRRSLKSGNSVVQVGAVKGMGHLATSRVGRVLVDQLDSRYPAVREAAVAALIEIGPSVAQRVRSKLSDPSAFARAGAVTYFAKHSNDVEFDEVVGDALRDGSWSVVSAAVDAAGQRKRRAHLPRLHTLLATAPSKVAVAAGEAYVQAAPDAYGDRVADILEDRRVPKAVRQAMKARLRADVGRRSFEILAKAAVDAGEKGEAAYRDLIVTNASEKEATALFSLLASRRPRLSAFASSALAMMGESIEDGALEALPSASIITREAILDILMKAPRDRMKAKVLEMAKSKDDERRVAAIRVMERMADNSLTPKLTELANDERPKVRMAALAALGPIPSASARVTLEEHLADPAADVQIAALRALAATPTQERNDRVLAALDDERPNVRLEAIRLLSPPQSSPVLTRFERMLETASASERIAIIQGIAKSKLPGADMLLMELVTHRRHEIRKAAVATVDQDW